LRFALEARKTIGVQRKFCRQDLERDVAIQIRIACAIHLAHAAAAKRREDFVRAERAPGARAMTNRDERVPPILN
jgi:hypothetical protein